MLLAPANNPQPPFCCPTHLDTPSYDDDVRATPLTTAVCHECQNSRPAASSGTLAGTVARLQPTSEASTSEGESSEVDDEIGSTTNEQASIGEEDYSEDYGAAREGCLPYEENELTERCERVTAAGRTSPTWKETLLEIPTKLAPTLLAKAAAPSSILRPRHALRRGVTRRRVRGLWSPAKVLDPFAQLHADVLQHTLSFLCLDDVCCMSMLSHRWKHVAKQEACYQTVEATTFVARAYETFARASPPAEAARQTGQALSDILHPYTPRSLTIRSIGDQLCPDNYLPALRGLQHLVLENFHQITDTHIHVWMVSSAGQGGGRPKEIHLRKLALNDCAKLSTAAVGSLARHCPLLQELSLQGCTRVQDVTDLAGLWRVEGAQHPWSSSNNLSRVLSSSLRSIEAPPLTLGAAPRLQPLWTDATRSWDGQAPPLIPTTTALAKASSSSVNNHGSSLFAPPSNASKGVSSLFVPPPKAPASFGSLFQAPPAAAKGGGGLSSLFGKPAPAGASARDNNPFSGFFAAPNPPPAAKQLPALFAPPPAKAPSNALPGFLVPPPSSAARSGIFAPPLSTETKKPSFADKAATGLFSPPSQLTSSDNSKPSNPLAGLFAPRTKAPATPTHSLSGGLFTVNPVAPSDTSRMSTPASSPSFSGLFNPPVTPKPSPARPGGKDNTSLCTPPTTEAPPLTPSNTLECEDDKRRPSLPSTGDKSTGLFVPPQNPDLQAPLSPGQNPAAGLESLFRPPGSSPAVSPHSVARVLTLHRHRASSTTLPATLGGRLDCINLSGTSVTPNALLESLGLTSGKVVLQSLACRSAASTWSEEEVRELTSRVSFAKLRFLDLEYAGPAVEAVASHSLAESQKDA